MLELILQVDWAIIMHEEKENHLEQEILPNSLNEPSLIIVFIIFLTATIN